MSVRVQMSVRDVSIVVIFVVSRGCVNGRVFCLADASFDCLIVLLQNCCMHINLEYFFLLFYLIFIELFNFLNNVLNYLILLYYSDFISRYIH